MTENDTETPRTPRWVKVFAFIGVVVVVLVVVMLIVGRGGHGPGRHAPGGDGGGGHTGPPPGVTHGQP
jgi:ABC-type transporter Mla subunit MlaD